MKRIVCILMILTMVLALAGCGSDSGSESDSAQTQAAEVSTENNTAESETEPADSNGEVDVDLTTLSSTMVYSEVYSMLTEPDEYLGRSVRMNGEFALYQAEDEEGNEIPGQIYFACIIADATACCTQGLEFVLAGDYTYPDDYPELGTDITVSGTFETYVEDGYRYCHLVDAVLEE